MNLLFEIFNKLILNESVNASSVTDSIKNRYRVTINYEGDPEHGIAPGLRTIEVYTYGLTKAGNPVIRAYQPYGDTASEVPNWKFFRLDRIKSWTPTYSLITKPADGFNPNGDKTMSVVYSIADFSENPNISNMIGPKQSPKIVGKIDNIEKILADREKEKQRKKEQGRAISRFKPQIVEPSKIQEPDIKSAEQIKTQNIQEPEIIGVEPETKQPSGKPMPIEEPISTEEPKPETFKTQGDEQLEKVKDLNRRLDQARKLDLSKIPRR